MESRHGAGAYIILFVIVVLSLGFLATSFSWLRESSPAVISANASAVSVSRDSLSALLLSSSQGMTYAIVSAAVFVGVVIGASTPVAIAAMGLMHLSNKKPNNYFYIVGESRNQLRSILPDLIEAGVKHEDTRMLVVQRQRDTR